MATLTGTVESRRVRRRVEEVVENISGVRDVENQLRVEESGEGEERTMAAGGGTRRQRGEAGEEGRSTGGSSRRSR